MIWRILGTAAAVALATWLVPGIEVTGADGSRKVLTLIVVAIVLALVNALVKPLMKMFTGCLILLSFGLFLWVINAALLMLTSYICTQLGVGWHVDTWAAAFIGALLISLVSWLLGVNRRQLRAQDR